jgi:UDP-2,3-diacylglucosamine hydrolase
MFYFVSDVHLGFYNRNQDKIIENQFLNFLNSIEDDCDTLFLLGDIFDYWFEYKFSVPKYYYRTLAKLEQFVAKKINIIYIMGNHDFGHKTFFIEEMGIKIIKNDLSIKIMNKKFFLSHGDGKLPKDYGYKILKKILRNKICQFLFTTIHPTIGIKLATMSSHSSRKKRNSIYKEDKLINFAKTKIEQGFDYVIMGHIHIAGTHKFITSNGNEGIYFNLGSWFSEPHYIKYNGTDINLIKVSN